MLRVSTKRPSCWCGYRIVRRALVGFLAVEFDQGFKWNLQYKVEKVWLDDTARKMLRQNFNFWLNWDIWSQTIWFCGFGNLLLYKNIFYSGTNRKCMAIGDIYEFAWPALTHISAGIGIFCIGLVTLSLLILFSLYSDCHLRVDMFPKLYQTE